jgi:hypothetical protein
MPGEPTLTAGLVSVTLAGARVGPGDTSTHDVVQSVLDSIQLAIEPFAPRMQQLGGCVVADIAQGLAEVKLQVLGLPPELADEVLARCSARLSEDGARPSSEFEIDEPTVRHSRPSVQRAVRRRTAGE